MSLNEPIGEDAALEWFGELGYAIIRACYQHCCLRYVMNEKMTNQVLRERFNLPEKKAEAVSRAIRDSVEAGKIKLADPEQASLRYRSYIPFWA